MKNDGPRRAASDAARDAKATEPPAFEVVLALTAERRQFEGWIAALDARRSTTPVHVFDRVQADYAARLDTVVKTLNGHASSLRDELEGMNERVSALTATVQKARDERAEAELRAHVGELSAGEWATKAASSDARLVELAKEQDTLNASQVRTRELLAEATRPAGEVAPLAEAAPVDAVTVDVPKVDAPKVDAPKIDALKIHSPTVPAPLVGAVEQDVELEVTPLMLAEADRAADKVPTAPAGRSSVEAPELFDTPPASAPPAAALESPRRTGFDELAFLSSVVDTPSGSMDTAPAERPDEASRRDSFAMQAQDAEIMNLTEESLPSDPPALRSADAPLAANVTGNVPIIIRDKPAAGAKSLKCSDCSAMNYPTEWYCERCGAELASL